jgi:3-hydroxyisobutyrate dehydrogenase-like beta-hydroxyacid dehydrogenase
MVGLGVMGSAFATHLLASGAEVIGYDIDQRRMADLGAAGGQSAESAADVAGSCSVVLTSLPTPEAFRDVIGGPRGLVTAVGRAGLLVVELSTFTLTDKEWGRQSLEAAGARMVDSPVSGTGAQARQGDLIAFVSADSPADRHQAMAWLSRFTRARYDVGAFGNGSRFKYVANLLVAVHNVAAAEALILAERAGLDLDLVLEAVSNGAGTSRMLEVRGPLIAKRNYEPTARVSLLLKDIYVISEFAEATDTPTPLLSASREIYEAARANGWSDQDGACVAEVLRGRAGQGG